MTGRGYVTPPRHHRQPSIRPVLFVPSVVGRPRTAAVRAYRHPDLPTGIHGLARSGGSTCHRSRRQHASAVLPVPKDPAPDWRRLRLMPPVGPVNGRHTKLGHATRGDDRDGAITGTGSQTDETAVRRHLPCRCNESVAAGDCVVNDRTDKAVTCLACHAHAQLWPKPGGADNRIDDASLRRAREPGHG